MSGELAALTIQKAYRGFKVRQKYGPLLNSKTGQIDIATSTFIRTYAKRWKEKSIFQVLMHYRAARYQDLVNLSQQVSSASHLSAAMQYISEYFSDSHLQSSDRKWIENGQQMSSAGEGRPTRNEPSTSGTIAADRQQIAIPFEWNTIFRYIIHVRSVDRACPHGPRCRFWQRGMGCSTTTRRQRFVAHFDGFAIIRLWNQFGFDRWMLEWKGTEVNIVSELGRTRNDEMILFNFHFGSTSKEALSRRDSRDSPKKPAVYKKRAAPVPAARDDVIRPAIVEKSATNPELNSVIGKLNPVKEMQILGRTRDNDVRTSASTHRPIHYD